MSRDDIGRRGEALAHLIITELCGRNEPYFRPWFLDSKFPTFDYIVHLVDHPSYYFFVQVKTTTLGYTVGLPPRLQVKVSQEDVDRMVACPAPSYVLGIDVNQTCGFWLSVNEDRDHVASLTTKFRSECKVLGQLYDEVLTYWATRPMVLHGSKFKE